jgi:hypothetical protein
MKLRLRLKSNNGRHEKLAMGDSLTISGLASRAVTAFYGGASPGPKQPAVVTANHRAWGTGIISA